MLGRPVGADDLDAEPFGTSPEFHRHRCAAEADAFHVRRVRRREIGVVEERRQEDRGARAAADVVGGHDVERVAGIPSVDDVDVTAASERAEHRAEHAGGVGDRRAHQGRPPGDPSVHVPQLAEHGAVVVDHTLRVAGGARRVGEHGDLVGRWGRQVAHRLERADGIPTDAADAGRRGPIGAVADHHVDAQALGGGLVDDGGVVDVAVRGGRDVSVGAALGEDERDLLAAVDVHDRHEHVATHRQRDERHDGFTPVRQLEGDDRTRLDPLGAEQRDESPGFVVDVGVRAVPFVGAGVDVDRGVRHRGEPLGDLRAERVVGPPSLLLVSRHERCRHRPL